MKKTFFRYQKSTDARPRKHEQYPGQSSKLSNVGSSLPHSANKDVSSEHNGRYHNQRSGDLPTKRKRPLIGYSYNDVLIDGEAYVP